jgi:DNA modification methylase
MVLIKDTKEGDIILDPMAGTGTTGAVAKKYGRKFIMIEKDENYCKIIKERLSKIKDRQRWLEEHKK